MNLARLFLLFVFCLFAALSTEAQYIAVGGGVVSSEDRTEPAFSTNFKRSGLIAVDAGASVFPFLTAGVHYSFTKPEVLFRRADSFGSSAFLNVGTHTFTFDARLRTPTIAGWRLYGLAGAGMARYNPEIEQEVETPFPPGTRPESETRPVFTFGGGVERSIFPLVRLKFEARDYVSSSLGRLLGREETWHRVAFIGGVVIGK